MNFAGSAQEGYGKRLFEQFPWQEFKPHPEWAEFVVKNSFPFAESQWIWFPEGNPAKDAPAAKRYFRRKFDLPEGKKILSARLRVTADDRFTASLNGQVLGSRTNFKLGKQFNDLGARLKSGGNTLAIMAENLPAPSANPAGLLARLEVKFTDGKVFNLITDGDWRAANSEQADWTSATFDDASWTNALAMGKYGVGPWNEVDEENNTGVYGPQSSGISGVLRMIYVPESQEIVARTIGKVWNASSASATGIRDTAEYRQ